MTLDELIRKVQQGGFSSSHVELARNGDGLWTAHFQVVEVVQGRDGVLLGVDQPFFRSKVAGNALQQLVDWLRGKSIRQRALGGDGIAGPWVAVPEDLEAPEVV